MLKKPDPEALAEGSSPELPVCSSVMVALATQHEDQRMVCALVASAMGAAHGALAVALDDVSALSGDVVAQLLRPNGKSC